MRCCLPTKVRDLNPIVFVDDIEAFTASSEPVMPEGQSTPIADVSRLALSKTLSEMALNQQSEENLSRNQSSQSLAEWDQPHQTEIIFDWDDTLFPTTWLRSLSAELRWQDPVNQGSPYFPVFRDIAQRVAKLLHIASELGSVSIVTLGAPSWLRHSLLNFIPEVHQAMADRQVKVAFARDEIDPTQVEHDSIQLKSRAMHRLLNQFYSHYPGQSWKNVVSIGDSLFERQALVDVIEGHDQPEGKRCRCKTLKLADAPDLEQFNSQLDLLSVWLRYIIRYDDDCDIDLNGDIDDVIRWKRLLSLNV